MICPPCTISSPMNPLSAFLHPPYCPYMTYPHECPLLFTYIHSLLCMNPVVLKILELIVLHMLQCNMHSSLFIYDSRCVRNTPIHNHKHILLSPTNTFIIILYMMYVILLEILGFMVLHIWLCHQRTSFIIYDLCFSIRNWPVHTHSTLYYDLHYYYTKTCCMWSC